MNNFSLETIHPAFEKQNGRDVSHFPLCEVFNTQVVQEVISEEIITDGRNPPSRKTSAVIVWDNWSMLWLLSMEDCRNLVANNKRIYPPPSPKPFAIGNEVWPHFSHRVFKNKYNSVRDSLIGWSNYLIFTICTCFNADWSVDTPGTFNYLYPSSRIWRDSLQFSINKWRSTVK